MIRTLLSGIAALGILGTVAIAAEPPAKAPAAKA